MYTGLKAILKRELELTPKVVIKDQEVGSHLKNVEDLQGFPIFP